MNNRKITHEVKLDRNIIVLLWGFVIALVLNILPSGSLTSNAFAALESNPTITLKLIECHDEYAIKCGNIDIDD